MAGTRVSTKRQLYRDALDDLGQDPRAVATYLSAHSNLPGPRGNLELADAFADWASDEVVDALADSGDEYLDFCVALAQGERLARGHDDALLDDLHRKAGDDRWRVREAVATGLQRVGDRDLQRLGEIVLAWAADVDPLVQRAAAAAICEPRLLVSHAGASTALEVCATITASLVARPLDQRRDPAVRVLRQALGYCWSVAVAADPEAGLPAFLRLRESEDPDVAWIVRENERKARLKKVLSRG